MTRGHVTQIQFNVQKQSKAGKNYSVTALKYLSDKGIMKTENIFDSATYASVVKNLGVGDEIEVSYIKNGEFFNVSDIKLLNKSTTGAAPAATPVSSSQRSSGGYVESPDKQASIQRQNALTNATHLVTAMLAQDMFKKTTKPSILIDEILKVADIFDGYTSGRAKIEILESSIPSSLGRGSSEEDDAFFGSDFPE